AVASELVGQFRSLAALRDTARAQAARDEARHQPRGVAERARAQAELGVDQLGVPENDGALRPRRGVLVDDRRLDTREVADQLAGIGDRRGREDELRLA